MAFSLRAPESWLVAALLTVGLTGSLACREQASAQQAPAVGDQPQVDLRPAQTAAPQVAEPEREGDRAIGREVHTVIDRDPALKNCPITFTIENGDITVTGVVRTETERQKINELVMQVSGVKSVANALRVSPG